jgi:APA family basic amino acid/polyamine antiporter
MIGSGDPYPSASSAPSGAGSKVDLIPVLGLFTATMITVGGVIGSGIFRKPGIMAGVIGSPQLLLAVWLLAGIITLIGALSNAEVAAMIPETGGQYVYFERIYGPFVAFLYGWAAFAVFQTASISAVSYVAAEYAAKFFAFPDLPANLSSLSLSLPGIGQIRPFHEFGIKAMAILLILVLTTVNYFGVLLGGLVQNIFSVAKVAAMMLLVFLAFAVSSSGSIDNLWSPSVISGRSFLGWVAAFAAALQGAFWAYDGWNKVTYVAGEIRDPQRNVPRSLFIGMMAVTGIYLLMNVAYAYVLPIQEMANSKLVAADVADRCIPNGGRWIAIAVIMSTVGATNAIILTTARVYFSMAQQKMFPAFVGRAHPRYRTPGGALWIQAIWAVVLLFTGSFDMLTDMLIFVIWLFYGAGALGVIVLRRKHPEWHRPYKVPGYPFTPAIFVVFALIYLVFTVYNDVSQYRLAVAAGKPAIMYTVFGSVLVLAGTPIYFYYRAKARRAERQARIADN